MSHIVITSNCGLIIDHLPNRSLTVKEVIEALKQINSFGSSIKTYKYIHYLKPDSEHLLITLKNIRSLIDELYVKIYNENMIELLKRIETYFGNDEFVCLLKDNSTIDYLFLIKKQEKVYFSISNKYSKMFEVNNHES